MFPDAAIWLINEFVQKVLCALKTINGLPVPKAFRIQFRPQIWVVVRRLSFWGIFIFLFICKDQRAMNLLARMNFSRCAKVRPK